MRDILVAILKTGSGSVTKLLLGMIATKVLATGLGPSGLGFFSLLRQTRDTLQSLASLNGITALVQGSASRQGKAREQYLLTTFLILCISTALTVIPVLLFAPQLAEFILQRTDQNSISLVRWLALPVALSTSTVYLSGVLNGYRAIGRLALTQVVSAAATALLAYPVVQFVEQGHSIAFIAMMTVSSAMGVALAVVFTRREGWLPSIGTAREDLPREVVSESGYHFLSFALTTLVTGSASTWAILAVRAMIVSQQGMSAAGFFDAAWTLSMMYVTLILSSFGTYYLPTLSGSHNIRDRISLIHRVLRLNMLLVVPLIMAVILLKPLLIRLLYSEEFIPALRIIRWMLIGDYLKTISWTFGVTIKAFADKKALFWSEILWQLGFVGFSALALLKFDSLEGVGAAFVALYSLYLIYTFHYTYKYHHFLPTRRLTITWLVGLMLLGSASIQTWSSTQIHWGIVLAWLALALVYSSLSMSMTEWEQVVRVARRNVSSLLGGLGAG